MHFTLSSVHDMLQFLSALNVGLGRGPAGGGWCAPRQARLTQVGVGSQDVFQFPGASSVYNKADKLSKLHDKAVRPNLLHFTCLSA